MSDVHAGVRWSLGGAERKVVQSVFYFFLKMAESHQGGQTGTATAGNHFNKQPISWQSHNNLDTERKQLPSSPGGHSVA